jgi:Tfp pilus assembly protein PilF
MAHVSLGAVLEERGDRGDLDGAEAAYRAAIAADPKYAHAHSHLGLILETRGDLDGAEAAFRAAIEADPQFALAYIGLSVVLDQRGDNAGAKAAQAKAAEYSSKAGLHDTIPPLKF